jgi:hypothetical protein
MSFPLPDHDWCFQVYVNNNKQFMVTWLEEQMFDVAERDIYGNQGSGVKE